MTLPLNNILLPVRLWKRGLEGSTGEKETNFIRKELAKPTRTRNEPFVTSIGMSASVTWKDLWQMASLSDLRGCQDSWWQEMLIKYTRNSTGQKMDANDRTVRLQIFINQKPRVYNTVPKVIIYRYETRWMEGPRAVHCTPYATVHDYPNIYKSWRQQTEINPISRWLLWLYWLVRKKDWVNLISRRKHILLRLKNLSAEQ